MTEAGQGSGAPGPVMFYHLTRRPLAETLAALAEKALERGWRVAVRGTDPARLDRLDQALWLGPEDRFLPHGLAGGPHDADQPVLLTTADAAPNGAACLMAVDGAPVLPAEAAAFQRVCILFDGADPDAVQHARGQWTALTAAGLGAQYWSEDSGRWEMKAER
jgi:DNA polymerase-3 subunit chi